MGGICMCKLPDDSRITYNLYLVSENIARNKPTEQSSCVSNDTDSMVAVDGNVNDGCATTGTDNSGSWWIVDLQQTYRVSFVKIINCCGMIL